jgi:hypothetical protein
VDLLDDVERGACEYCGFSELSLCSPLVRGQSRSESMHSSFLEAAISEENLAVAASNSLTSANQFVHSPYLPSINVDDSSILEGPVVHEVKI